MSDTSVVLKNLSIGYQTKQGTRVVAGGVTASLKRGRLTCLLGENGVGKSTLLRTLAAFLPKLDGEILLEGRPLEEYKSHELARTIGIVLTEKPDVQQMSVTELVEMGRTPYTGFWGRLSEADKAACREAISLIGIDHLKDRPVQTLSDGERQKTMIAKALAQQTPVIYLDEPTAFLDYPSKVEMLLLLRRISREAQKTIFLSTHDLELALQVADTVWLMNRTEGLQIGTPHELAASGALRLFVERGANVRFDAETLSVRVLTNDD
ncbi:MAG: ABC transporter ATP-binding protein [Prevotella sp.]|nr:ABC transporter ATP-binding protein [Prevotella sp.]